MLLAAFLVFSLISAALSTNRWAAERAVAISLAGAALFWVASALRKAGLGRPLLVALALAVVVAAGTSLAQAYGVQSEYFSLNRVPGGTFGNRNFVAHLAAIGTPVVDARRAHRASGIGQRVRRHRDGGGRSDARAVSKPRGMARGHRAVRSRRRCLPDMTWARWSDPRTCAGLSCSADRRRGRAGRAVRSESSRLEEHSPYLDSAAGLVNYKGGSGAGRLVQYENSLAMTRAHPAFGVGPGNWPVVYPKFASRNDPSMSQSVEGTDIESVAEQRLGRVSVGARCDRLPSPRAGHGGSDDSARVRDVREGIGHDPEHVLTSIALVGTLVATAVVGAFDAVLLIAVPTYFVWTLAGALRPLTGGAEVEVDVRRVIPGLLAGGRSGRRRREARAKWPAIDCREHELTRGCTRSRDAVRSGQLSSPNAARRSLRHPRRLLRARPQARAARDLFPSAAEPKRALAQCGGQVRL